MSSRSEQERRRPNVNKDDLQVPRLKSPLPNTMPPRSQAERGRRIIENVKCNEPDVTAQRDQILRCVLRTMEASAHGEAFVYTPLRIFLILEGPYTLQTVQTLANERHEWIRKTSEKRRAIRLDLAVKTSNSNTEDKLSTPEILTAEIARIVIYNGAEQRWVEREEVTGVRLPRGTVGEWWRLLNARLHDRAAKWPLGMEYYIERLKGGVSFAGTNMEAFMVMRHFEIDEEKHKGRSDDRAGAGRNTNIK